MKEHDYILTIYEEQSFSRAAKKLFVSQPALSLAVKRVEEDLGITIFDRSSLSIRPTDEGLIYIAALKEINLVERNMRDRLSDMASLSSGNLVVSGENFVSSFILPQILMEFSKNYPGIQIQLVESNSPDLRQLLLSEQIDLLVAHDFDPNQYEAKELFDETVLLAVPITNPINRLLADYSISAEELRSGKYMPRKPVDLAWFKNEDFLLLKPGNDLNWRASDLFEAYKVSPKVKISLDQLITSYNLACAGLGIAFVTDILVEKTFAPGCVYYTIDHPIAHRKMFIGYKKNRYFTRAASAFVETAQNVYRR